MWSISFTCNLRCNNRSIVDVSPDGACHFLSNHVGQNSHLAAYHRNHVGQNSHLAAQLEHNNTVHTITVRHIPQFTNRIYGKHNSRPLYRVTLTFRSYGALIESERGLSLCTVLKIRHLFNNLV